MSVVGESGCGKSVTASSILGLLPRGIGRISSGEILLNGRNIAGLPGKDLRQIRGSKISMIFQEPMTSLNPVHRIGAQLVEALQAHRKISRRDARQQAIDMLARTGIPSPETRIDEYPHQLSGGQRQRVMIAMALLASPDLLIADEPTTALDVTVQAQILDLLKEIKVKMSTSVLLITHDMGVVAEAADTVAVMYAGWIVESGPVREIFNRPLHPYTSGLLRSIPRPDRDTRELESIDGTVPPFSDMPQGCRFCTRCLKAQDKCRTDAPPVRSFDGRTLRCWNSAQE
jgi:oligopeptide/dipeptide ABC transporter ATP-binding protein